MPPKLNPEYIKEQKIGVKLAIKGRLMAFGVVARSKRIGLFRVSKKEGLVNQKKKLRGVKITPYDESGKDSEEAKELNNGEGLSFVTGSCVNEGGVLKLYVKKGTEKKNQEVYARHFISRSLRLKSLKDVQFFEVDELPVVKEDDPKDKDLKPDASKIASKIAALTERLKKLGGLANITERLNKAAAAPPEKADDLLDDPEAAIVLLETARNFKDAKVFAGVQEKLLKWEFEEAEKIIDAAAGVNEDGEVGPSKPGGAASNGVTLKAAAKVWNDAGTAVNSQIGKLTKKLKSLNDDQLSDIADNGLKNLDDGMRALMDTALKSLEEDPADVKRKKAVTDLIGKFGGHIGKDERIKVCDENPFDVEVMYKECFNVALKRLVKAVKATPIKK
jgi:hypothetical protein